MLTSGRSGAGVATHLVGAAPEQCHRASRVSPAGVREPDGDLGQPPPQLSVGSRRGFPGGLENLVRVKRAAFGEEAAAERYRLVRGHREVIGESGHVDRGSR
jgi:hypothetical protein